MSVVALSTRSSTAEQADASERTGEVSRARAGGLSGLPGKGKLRALGVRSASELVGDTLPVRAELAELFPAGGLRPGNTVAALGSTSLTLALLAEASAQGHPVAVVGRPDLGLLAAHELGVAFDQLAVVPDPGRDPLPVLDALFDGFAIVAVAARWLRADARETATLRSRARHRRVVLLVDAPLPGVDVLVRAVGPEYVGPRDGYGRVRGHRLRVVAERGHGPTVASAELNLPGPDAVPRPVRGLDGNTAGRAVPGMERVS